MRDNGTETTYYIYDREDRIPDYDTNGQGSIRALVDENGNVVYDYFLGPIIAYCHRREVYEEHRERSHWLGRWGY